jgi:subtilisin-like proprotein convertase family protein
MAADFTQYADVGLPGSSAVVESSLVVVGLATVPVDLTVELDIVHASSSNLVLTLVDPGGETALLWNGPTEGRPPSRIVVTRGISRDASVNGRWLLRAVNPSGIGSGRLREWRLKVTSRWD